MLASSPWPSLHIRKVLDLKRLCERTLIGAGWVRGEQGETGWEAGVERVAALSIQLNTYNEWMVEAHQYHLA